MKVPTAADLLAYARLMNGVCEKCGTLKAHDGTPRCQCTSTFAAAELEREANK